MLQMDNISITNHENIKITKESISSLNNYTTNLLSVDINLDLDAKKVLAQILSEEVDPLITKFILSIKPILIDFIIKERKRLLCDSEITTVHKAAEILNISHMTIYRWISLGTIEIYNLDNKSFVSISQIKYVMDKKKNKK